MKSTSITLTVETSTALFMHGANPRKVAELRAPSIKGVMRYWFRALAGGMTDLKTLKGLESSVFGSTEVGQGVSVRIKACAHRSRNKRFLLPHRPDNPPVRKGDVDKFRILSTAFEERTEFSIILSDFTSRDRLHLEVAAWSLWLAINLGGFGQRARRGAGNLTIVEIEPPIEKMPEQVRSCALQELRDHIESGLKEAKNSAVQLIQRENRVSVPDYNEKGQLPPFPILFSSNSNIKIAILQESNEQTARKIIMKGLSDFKNPVWGLPYGSPTTKTARMASPVWIHLLPKANNGFFIVYTKMGSQFPEGTHSELNWSTIDDYFIKQNAIDVRIL